MFISLVVTIYMVIFACCFFKMSHVQTFTNADRFGQMMRCICVFVSIRLLPLLSHFHSYIQLKLEYFEHAY